MTVTTDASVILLEFNELTPSLMDRFMREGKLPNFRRLWSQANVYMTDAEETPPALNPWIQWVTVHSGLSFTDHGVFHLGDGHKFRQKCIWDLVSDANLRVWVCGSMNVKYDLPLNGAILPDPWTSEPQPYPEELAPYVKFVQKQVQEHTNDHIAVSRGDYVQFLRFMSTHGLSVSTISEITQQLLRERMRNSSWKRTVILDKLQWDLFRWYYRKLKPHFSTFFLNSTAHFQHKYWRNMEPEHFKIRPTTDEQNAYEAAILFGYQEMDKLVGGFLELANGDTTIILCTALSQQPCLLYEDEGGKCFYRPKNFADLFSFSGIDSRHTVAPVMSEQFQIHFEDVQTAQKAESLLLALRVNGRPVMLAERNGASIFSGCHIYYDVPRDAVLTINGTDRSIRFLDMFYQADSTKSGMHHPDGLLWISDPNRKQSVHQEKVSLRSVAPTILKILGVPRPNHMQGSLLS